MRYEVSEADVDEIWNALHRALPRAQVAAAARLAAADFADEVASDCMPLFVRRATIERLWHRAAARSAPRS